MIRTEQQSREETSTPISVSSTPLISTIVSRPAKNEDANKAVESTSAKSTTMISTASSHPAKFEDAEKVIESETSKTIVETLTSIAKNVPAKTEEVSNAIESKYFIPLIDIFCFMVPMMIFITKIIHPMFQLVVVFGSYVVFERISIIRLSLSCGHLYLLLMSFTHHLYHSFI